MTSPDPIPIGQYRGFDMELSFDTFSREYKITLIHQLRHTVTLGTDIFGNIQRLDNALGVFEERMAACAEQMENTRVQLENAKAEVSGFGRFVNKRRVFSRNGLRKRTLYAIIYM